MLNTASVELGAFVDEWEYDVAGAGLLHNETRIVGVGNGQSATVFDRTYHYDAYYRPAGYSVELDPYQYPDASQAADIPVLPLTARYEVGMEYDGYFARVKSITYPQERFRLYQRYDQNGYLWQEGDSRNQSHALKSVTAMNPANQVTAETFGNGTTQTYVHHQRTFQMQNTKVNGGNLLTQSYNYDLYGNLTELKHQQGNNALRTETFGYDHLHRLTQSQRSGVAPILYSYDAIGNLTEKDDFADSYSYGSGRPNAVSSVTLSGGGTANYGYDANGNMTTAQGNGNSQAAQDVGELALKYDPYNKPFFIERNGKRSEFWYGPDDQRYFQLENGNQRTVYIDKLYEQIGSTVHKLYLGDYALFTVDVTSAANSGVNYLHKDRLGSIVSITDESGNLIANAGRSFDPFGKPREEDLADSNGITHAPMPDAIGDLNRPDITTRGFTGHEQLNNLSLTHMNGRVYDYNLGRFLGVDPIIAFPENSQSLNPYSYILNNPLSGTDPTGYVPTCRDDPSLCGRDVVGGTSFDCQRGANCDSLILSGNVDNGLNDDNVKSVLVAGDVSTLEGPENISVNNIDLIEGDDGRHTVLITIGGTENKDLLPVVTHYARDGVVSVLPGLPKNLASVRTHDVPRWLLAPESFERPRSGTAGYVLEAAVGLTGVGGFALGGYELFTGTSLFTGAKVSRILAAASFIPFARVYRSARGVTKGLDETADLFRAVSPAEFDDIVKTGKFNLGPSGFGKQFGHSFDEILRLADFLPDTSAIIKVKVFKNTLNFLDHTPVDRHILRSGTITVQPENLDRFNQAVRSIEHIL